jgi:hypothetical protein
LKLKLAGYKVDEDDAKRAYDGYLMGLDDYFARRRDLVEKRLAAEIAALDKQRALADTEKDPEKRKGDQDRIATAASFAALEAEGQLKAIASEESKASDESLRASLAALKKLLESRGEVHAARMLEISEEASAERDRLARTGLKGAELEAQVENFRGRAEALADFEEDMRNVEATLTDLQDSADVTPRQIQRLRDLADALAKVAESLGPEAVKKVKELKQEIDNLTQSTDYVEQLGSALQGALGSWLGSTINQVTSLADAFRSLGQSIAAAVQQALAAEFAKKLIESIPGFSGGGKVEKKARGGLIRGPGGPLSDNVFALLSNGEYVVRASAVARPGMLSHLEAVNRGEAPRYVSHAERAQANLRHYAMGGLVTPRPMAGAGSAGGSQIGGSVTLNLPPGVTVQTAETFIQTPDGQRLLVKMIAKNSRAIGQILR